MKRFITFAFACFPLMCVGAPSISYTTYFNNTHTYTNSTTAGTNSASRGVFTNGITAGASTFTGVVGFADGAAATPPISYSSQPAVGFRVASSAGQYAVSVGTDRIFLGTTGINLQSTGLIGWSSGSNPGSAPDTSLTRDGAANTLALRNAANAQTFNVYNTYTDASNYERLGIFWSGNILVIRAQNAGTGIQRSVRLDGADLNLMTANLSRWQITSAGHLLAGTDNTYDIGASGATRPRNVYVAGFLTVSSGTSFINQLQVSATSGYIWQTRSRMLSPADGVIELVNNAETDFNRLQFGGTSTNFNAIAAVTNVAGKPYLKFTDATGANLRKIVNVGHQGGYTNVLSDAVATSVFYIAVPSTNIVAGKVVYEIAATDGTDTQGISGECKFVAVGKSTTVTAQIADVQTTAAASAGTLTTAVAANVATNNVLAITIDANTSLTTTNLVAKWRVESAGLFDVNQVIP